MNTKTQTLRSTIRSYFRQMFLRSRERAAALKRDNYTCQVCNKKQSTAKGKEVKVQVHHRDGVKIDELTDLVYTWLLHHPDRLITLCKECHDKEHKGNRGRKKKKTILDAKKRG